jgi:coniferyl-aldehyde dehydrogenase
MADIMATLNGLKHARDHVAKWAQPSKRKVAFPMNILGAKAQVEYQPKGVIGNIATWNFPTHVALAPLAGIFAAGNRCMIKMSELTPQVSGLLEQLIAKYFDETELLAVNGGPDIGAAFAALPFDHILFTGATGIGRHILHAAADNLTPVTLELGGKSPVIISRSADIEKTANRIMAGKAMNIGQVCLSPDYCFVAEEQRDALVDAMVKRFSEMFPTIIDNPDYTSVVNARHLDRLQSYIADAREKGADVREINPANEDMSTQQGTHKMPLHIVVDPTDDMLVMQEELFGAIICVKSYKDINDAIRYVNSRPRPLALYYFGEDKAEERKVLDKTISGGVALNDVMAHTGCENLPFGGVGASGMGNYHGHAGFLTFSHEKAVYRQTKVDLTELAGMNPPYTDKCRAQLDKLTDRK